MRLKLVLISIDYRNRTVVCPHLLHLLTESISLGGGDCLSADAVNTLPQSVGLANIGLPQSQCSVLTAASVELPVRREANTVDWTKVTFEVLNLQPGLVVKLVELEILSAAHEDISVLVERGGVGWGGNVDLLDLLEPDRIVPSQLQKGTSGPASPVGIKEDDLVSGSQGDDVPLLAQLHPADGF